MEESNTLFYALILINVKTLHSDMILCNGLEEVQIVLDNTDEEQNKISLMQLDDVLAYQQWMDKLDEKPSDFNGDNDIPFNLN